MKTIIKSATAVLLAMSFASGAFAEEFTKGTVKKIDTKAKKVTLIHEELKNLDMPAMTMVFKVEDDELFGKLKVGQKIEFVADRVNGQLLVTEVK
ncbi:copper-binding protein [Gellertiella hungarica]|uniref:Cu/Ag efflux protein CusF n=1 Tax=Gellertiella hungarica TaxID=1572859 RepID=A0A7W6NND1_9HYPH|nr:copper-binding protein [Gellertiella hungarica]MBB4067267.1 Cu/Ag efflux protein CusF [Gellertiella hungarica]